MVKIELPSSGGADRIIFDRQSRLPYQVVLNFPSRPGPWIVGKKEEGVMGSSGLQQKTGWLVENGLKELELLFRTVLYHPSEPILIADSDRHYVDANSGAGRLLGRSRDQIIGRRIDDFAEA